MKNALKAGIAAMALMVFAAPAFAQNVSQDVIIRQVVANGSGCPAQSTVAVLNGNLASILFSQYRAVTTQNRRSDQKACTVSLAMSLVSNAISLTAVQIQWNGNAIINRGSNFLFQRFAGFTGAGSVQRTLNVRGTSDGQIVPIQEVDTPMAITITGCRNTNVIANFRTTIAVTGPAGTDVAIDQADAVGFQQILVALRPQRITC
jgi:hypothetical protein